VHANIFVGGNEKESHSEGFEVVFWPRSRTSFRFRCQGELMLAVTLVSNTQDRNRALHWYNRGHGFEYHLSLNFQALIS